MMTVKLNPMVDTDNAWVLNLFEIGDRVGELVLDDGMWVANFDGVCEAMGPMFFRRNVSIPEMRKSLREHVAKHLATGAIARMDTILAKARVVHDNEIEVSTRRARVWITTIKPRGYTTPIAIGHGEGPSRSLGDALFHLEQS